MKKTKLALLALPLMLLSVTGCDRARWHIGISQLLKHAALNEATRGFMDAVEEGLGKGNVKFDLQIAGGEASVCSTIANTFASKNVDLIMANATPALQAAFNTTETIPILGTSITDYASALNLEDFNGVVGGNVSGTSDLAPLSEQADMVLEIVPTAQKVGLLYCSAEANSIYQVNIVDELLRGKGLTTTKLSFSDSNDISMVLSGAAANLDVLYIPTDNTCADAVTTIDAICKENNLPVITGEENMCKKCGVATLSINYYTIGVKTGEMAVEILRDGKDISKMPIQYDDSPVKKYNPSNCTALGITIPEGYVALE